MRLVVRYVRMWVYEKAANETIKPTQEIAEKSRIISSHYSYEVTTVADMLELYCARARVVVK